MVDVSFAFGIFGFLPVVVFPSCFVVARIIRLIRPGMVRPVIVLGAVVSRGRLGWIRVVVLRDTQRLASVSATDPSAGAPKWIKIHVDRTTFDEAVIGESIVVSCSATGLHGKRFNLTT